MKKINILLSGLLLGCLGLTGCGDDKELPPIAYPDGGSQETIGTGEWDDPFSVWQVLAGVEMAEGQEGVWVTGYIVGYINTFDGDYAKLREKSAVFSAVGAPNSNLLLAMTPEETDWEKCIPVQLAYGTSGRDLSLGQHPDYLHREVTLYGTTGAKYLSVYGLRNCSTYNWGDEGKPAEGQPDQSGSITFLTNGFGDFTFENVTVPSGTTYVWSWDSYNYAKASAYVGGSNQNAESYLVSPAIELAADQTYATFSQALNYLRGNNRADYIDVCVREAGQTQWTMVEVSDWPEGSDWVFIDNCAIDLSGFAGKTIQIGFHYRSTTACSPTWEVKKLVIPGTSL